MLQAAKFYLIKNISKSLDDKINKDWFKFVETAKIFPLTTDTVNNKATKNLEVRLAEQLPEADWGLTVTFTGFKWNFNREATTIQPGSVVISGEILNRLHSLILYNAINARLKMKMSIEFSMQSNSYGFIKDPERLAATIFKQEIELYPRVEGQDSIPCANTYTANSGGQTSVKTEIPAEVNPNKPRPHTAQLSNFSVWVEGIDYDFSQVCSNDVMVGQKRLLHTGICSDVTILTSEESKIQCHKIVLIGQSPVLETMLKDKVYVEGETGEISMRERSKEEVMSFLAFLYYGELKKTLTDTDLAVTLFEMAHYYDVKGLESGIKPILLSRPAESFEVDAALRLFNVVCGLNDLDLKRKAADVLETRSNEVVFKSPLFNGLSVAVVKELFAMCRRMF